MDTKTYLFRQVCTLAFALGLTACGKNFLEQVPQDQLTVDNFYQTEQQVNAATATLYGFPWFNLNDKSVYAIGDMMGGNMFSYDGAYRPFQVFTVQPDNPRLAEAWESLFKVVAIANSVVKYVPTTAPAEVPRSVVNRAVGEARFNRALAYFYLVRTWGAVPIIENSEALAANFQIPRNRVEDVYQLIIRDLQFAEANCPATYSGANLGRVTSGAASGLLAKVYLYQKDYANARASAEKVINSGTFALMPNYAALYRVANNYNLNAANRETLFAWQWVALANSWGVQNTNQAYFAPFGEGITEVGDGWGSILPSRDLVAAYEPNDKRRKATLMMAGDVYPELTSKTNPNGYTYPATAISPTLASPRKYVVGSPTTGDGGRPVLFMKTEINTQVLRLAEVYLIAAEAIMGAASTTADGKALQYFNLVRARAGLPAKTTLTSDDLLKERRVELAFEHDYWYDLGRIDRARATAIINAQNRGTADTPESFQVRDSDWLLPIPQANVAANPRFLDQPEPYKFQ